MNKWVGIGRITKDLELKKTTSGKSFVNFSLAVNRQFKNQNGEYEVDFINCQVWDKQAESMVNYVGKGSQVAVSGRIQVRKYENNEGNRVYITEIICDSVQFLDSKKDSPKQEKSIVDEFMPSEEVNSDNLPF